MTIRTCINAAALNECWSYLERCADEAPEGTYEDAKELAEFVGEMSNTLLKGLRGLGLKVHNDDRLREVQAVIYGYIEKANPEAYFLMTAEGFGEHIYSPAGAGSNSRPCATVTPCAAWA